MRNVGKKTSVKNILKQSVGVSYAPVPRKQHTPTKHTNKLHYRWFILLLLAVATLAGIYFYGQSNTQQAQAAISTSALTSGGAGPGIATADTASITPTSNALVLLWVENLSGGSAPATPTVSGNSLTWTQVTTVEFNTTASSLSRLTLFKAQGASPTAGVVTIDFGGATQGNCVWSISEYTGVSTANPITQYASNRGDSVSSLTVTLSAFASTDNITVAGFGADQNVAIDHDTGWTEVHDFSSVPLPSYSRLETQWYGGNDTTATGTMNSGTADMAGIAVEISTAPTCYWVGDTNPAVWNDASHWSNASGGTPSTCDGGIVPNASTNVVFDGGGTNNVTVDASIDVASLTLESGYTGTFDNATGDQSVTISGNVIMDNDRVDMGDATWTVSGDFDNQDVTTFYRNASTLVMDGTSKQLISSGATKGLNNVTIDTGASITVPFSSDQVYAYGTFNTLGTLDINSGEKVNISDSSSDLKVGATGSITGAGTLTLLHQSKLSQQAGTIDVDYLEIGGDHTSSYPIVAATYDSANVLIHNYLASAQSWQTSSGTYTFPGNVTFNGNSSYASSNYTIDNVDFDANFVFQGNLTITNGNSTLLWLKGDGLLTFTKASWYSNRRLPR